MRTLLRKHSSPVTVDSLRTVFHGLGTMKWYKTSIKYSKTVWSIC